MHRLRPAVLRSTVAALLHFVGLALMDKALYSSTSLTWLVQAELWLWPSSQQCFESDEEALLVGCMAAHRAHSLWHSASTEWSKAGDTACHAGRKSALTVATIDADGRTLVRSQARV